MHVSSLLTSFYCYVKNRMVQTVFINMSELRYSFLFFVLLSFVSSCTSDDDSPTINDTKDCLLKVDVVMRDIAYRTEEIMKSNLKKGISWEYFHYQTMPNNQLYLRHSNAVYGIGENGIKAEATLKGNVIHIHEQQISKSATAYGRYDLIYNLGPLEAGNYEIVVENDAAFPAQTAQFQLSYGEDTRIIGRVPRVSYNPELYRFCYPQGEYQIRLKERQVSNGDRWLADVVDMPLGAEKNGCPTIGETIILPHEYSMTDFWGFSHEDFVQNNVLHVRLGRCEYYFDSSKLWNVQYITKSIDNLRYVSTQLAKDSIVGRWVKIRQGNILESERNEILDFDENGGMQTTNMKVRIETDEVVPLCIESAYQFESDWHSDSVNGLTGHLYLSRSTYSKPGRYLCSFIGGQMVLVLDEGDGVYYNDPTEYFERIK